jgi:aryl-alcohol dehydrogenase-like predicted oxidoreductase
MNLQESWFDKVKKLGALASDLSMSTTQLAIAWVLKNPDVSTAILGASKLYQLEENLKAGDAKNKLTAEVLQKIEEVLANQPQHPPF